jgi:hypothetical protein
MYENIIKICLIILTILIISVLIIKRFIYFKPSTIMLESKENYKDIFEGHLHGWLINGTNNKIILYCHGNTGNISTRQIHIDKFNNLGYSVLIFDYSGYGQSKGIPSEQQLYQDASSFTELLIKTEDKNNIIVYGESIGSAVGAHIARKYKLPILIINSGLPSIQKYIKHHYPFFSFLSPLFTEFNTEIYLQGYTGKTLVIHSLQDEIIPYNSTELMRSLATKTIDIKGTHKTTNIPFEEINNFILF